MSGVYIKGMQMPEPGTVLDVKVYSDGLVTVWDKKVGWIHHHAIPVPDHGRLVDADALYKDLLEDVGYGEAERFNDYWLGEQPTIIPADKEGEA